jgi:hypothetical protein
VKKIHKKEVTQMKRIKVSLILAVAVILAVASIAAADASGRKFTTELTGAAEVPGPGDPDGSGSATLRLNPGLEQVCWQIAVSDVEPITAAHIHVGASDVAGPVVVPLFPPLPDAEGSSSGCISADRELILDILRNPENYYVNVHNAEFPAGALRGQLSK